MGPMDPTLAVAFAASLLGIDVALQLVFTGPRVLGASSVASSAGPLGQVVLEGRWAGPDTLAVALACGAHPRAAPLQGLLKLEGGGSAGDIFSGSLSADGKAQVPVTLVQVRARV